MVRLLHVNTSGYVVVFTEFQSHNGAIAALTLLVRSLHSLIVSIPQWCDCCWVCRQSCRWFVAFQSHNGAIAAFSNITRISLLVRFQSHNGAIAATAATTLATTRPRSFNPTMVRFLPQVIGAIFYHYGSFNPTMVRLLPLDRAVYIAQKLGFNPTMVRLLLAEIKPRLSIAAMFQSHNGAIAADQIGHPN